ncbi:MAG: D-alanyl-D-alanine carboxypeptidase DacC [Oligoflexia bacterium]|nr:MAG: D-alanyl-D-alanine carboxypeptidase DacC [Oligoflexia bacterium]
MKTIFFLSVACLISYIPYAFASEPDWVAKSKKKISNVVDKSGIKKAHLAIYIGDGEQTPYVVYELNGAKKFIPASITKLVTAATTLVHFPPGTKFKTQLMSQQNQIKGEVLKGNLYLKGGGDPSFVSESMWFLVNAFVRTGIKTIEGDIVVDDSYFDKLRIDPSRENARVDRAYDAPISAMSFNWNSVNVFVRPADNGEDAHVFADPENEYIRLKSSVKTVGVGKGSTVIVDRDEDAKGNGDVLKVSGKIGVDSKEVVIYKNITQPDIWAGYNLKAFLKQRGIEIKGKVVSGLASGDILAESESKPIEQILADMNKFSNNYVAEMLAKNIAAKFSTPGNIPKAMDKMREYLASIGVKKEDYEIYNPSGLTRDNKFTAQSLWMVLHDMKDQFQYQPEFFTSLPIAGVDGTLKKRLKETRGERWVRAKTGLLTGVVSLAGYAGRRDGTVLPFVMMYNGSEGEAEVRTLFDKIALSLIE